ncbi:BLUF domain-containing protein [Marinobacterium sp. MBR-109]|uniref:BLUF domain-containing protein n=1 Tax=Marinobacterium sp. MBR-109 TaxID=3156462 RepID=UPI0033980F84
MALEQLIYVSTAVREMSRIELETLLEGAVRFNNAHQLTGMLLYAEGSFLQVIEGETADMDAVFERISRDPQHHSLQVLIRTPISVRSFSAWHMGFRMLGQKEVEEHPGFAPFFEKGFDAASIGAHEGLAWRILKEFADSQQRG